MWLLTGGFNKRGGGKRRGRKWEVRGGHQDIKVEWKRKHGEENGEENENGKQGREVKKRKGNKKREGDKK